MSGQLVLITGSTSGIGHALAYLLASEGMRLILAGRDSERLSALALELKNSVVLTLCRDLTDRKPVVDAIWAYRPDLIINCAGFGLYGEAADLATSEQLKILEINGSALLEITLEGAKALLEAKKRGTILNISSVAGEHPSPGMAVYGASKAFVTMLSKALDMELAPRGVRVLASSPGMVATQFAERAAKRSLKSPSGPVMSPEFAAITILRQLRRGKRHHIFNWYYRLGSWAARHFVSEERVGRLIYKRIFERL